MNIQTPNSRNTDPSTSHLAGAEITRSGRRQRQLDLVVGLVQESEGKTSAELALFSGYDRSKIARRLPDAEGIYLKKGEPRKCTVTGSLSVTWWME